MPSNIPKRGPSKGNGDRRRKRDLALGGAAALLNTPAAATGLLNMAGFTAGGVTGGSLAAVAQSTLYGASTRGAFSFLQSIATKTLLPPPVGMVIAAASVGVQSYRLYKRWSDTHDDDDEDDKEEEEEEGKGKQSGKEDGKAGTNKDRSKQ